MYVHKRTHAHKPKGGIPAQLRNCIPQLPHNFHVSSNGWWYFQTGDTTVHAIKNNTRWTFEVREARAGRLLGEFTRPARVREYLIALNT